MYKRSQRLKELFFQQVSEILRELKDPGLSGFLTVTDLDLSPDMKTARVYYSILGSSLDRESTARALERSSNHVRSALLARLDIRFAPRIIFQYDDTPERANRIENLLNVLDREKDAGAPAPDPSGEETLKRPAPGASSDIGSVDQASGELHRLASGKKAPRPGKRRKS